MVKSNRRFLCCHSPSKTLVLPRLMNPKGHGAIAHRLDMFALRVQRAAVPVVAHAEKQHVLRESGGIGPGFGPWPSLFDGH